MKTSIFFSGIVFLAFTSCSGGNSSKNTDNKAVTEQPAVETGSSDQKLLSPANTKFDEKIIEVNSFEELYKNIGNNRTLKLKEGVFTLPEKIKTAKNINVDLNYGLVIRGITNMKIIGAGSNATKIIQPNPSFKVIEFNGCENIVIENIVAGHEPEKGFCAASVFIFSNCKDIFLNNSILYGSGYEGLTTFKVENFNCSKTTIRECSFQIMSVSQSNHLRFFDCIFTENNKPSGSGKFYLAQSDVVVFNNCEIKNNAAYIGNANAETLFKIEDCEEIYLQNSKVENNIAAGLSNNEKTLIQSKNTISANSWQTAN